MPDESHLEPRQEPADLDVLVQELLPEFEASLANRAKVPAVRISEYLGVSEAEVRMEGGRVADVLRRFAQAVVDAMESPRCADEFLRELDLKSVSRDHDWRKIFKELRSRDPSYDEHKRVLIIKYLQYLSFRKRLLEFIHDRRQGLEETADREVSSEPIRAPRGDAGADGAGEPEFERLPLGETVQTVLPPSGAMEVTLGKRVFRLEGATHPCLIDPNGVSHFLRQGRNMVGRHPESDVVVEQSFSDVSRAHAIMDWVGDGVVRITDLSTRGTFVTPGSVQDKI